MRLSRYFLPTLKEAPSDAQIVSHALMLRAGLIKQEAAGIYAWLPLGMTQGAQERPTDGAQWGAPAQPNLKRKFITTSWVSLIVWAVVMVLVFIGWMPLPDLAPPA